ncbi:MAG: bifunctional isocitrate dehydrogenase kinase/phosphatase, partial [Bacteroidota bacterium]
GITKRAGIRFEARDWHGIQSDARERLTLYRKMVGDTTEEIRHMLDGKDERQVWRKIKKMYAEDVFNFNARDLAETFYNSVYRHYHQGLSVDREMMFVMPTHEENEFHSLRPIFKTYSSNQTPLQLVEKIIDAYKFEVSWENKQRDLSYLVQAIQEDFLNKYEVDEDTRVEMLRSVFYRNKCAYLIGRAHIQDQILPFILPILHNEDGLYIDTLLTDYGDVGVIFSYYRSYFMVDIEIPSEYVDFLSSIMPRKKVSEIYNSIGFEKHGKTELYREFLKHLHQSDDQFVIAPGIKGMVMSVFTLPSYDVVFKLIKDKFDAPKKTTRQKVKDMYALVRRHDRVGRMSDTHEFENFVFPRERFSDELLKELQEVIPSLLEISEDIVKIKHLYTEKKMVPLNLYLESCTEEEAREAVDEYGNAIKQLAAANIFPGDMLLKNFGVTHMKRVVFYDYDEICFVTDCNFRIIPEARNEEEEMSATRFI